MGPVSCRRAYYYCGRCGQGLVPWDRAVGLTARSFSPAAEEVVCLAGTVSSSFAEAAEQVLRPLAGLKVAESTVQRTTEAAGQRVAEHLGAGGAFAGPARWEWRRDARGRTCAYVGIDLTSVRQQGEAGGKADGRMPYVAMVFNPVPELPDGSPYAPASDARMQARYLSGLYDLDQLGDELRKQAGQVGMSRAEQWIGLTDGGAGLEAFVRRNFPRDPVLILDFWHASEYLVELGHAVAPADAEGRQRVVGAWCRTLKREGGAKVVEVLEGLEGLPAGAAEKRATALTYFRNNLHRMDYPTYVANGWSIGSGAVESACKTVVGQRLKLAGMRWREYGTNALCHLRALYRSGGGQWQAFWRRPARPRAA